MEASCFPGLKQHNIKTKTHACPYQSQLNSTQMTQSLMFIPLPEAIFFINMSPYKYKQENYFPEPEHILQDHG